MTSTCWFGAICFFFFNDTATTEIYTLSLHDALPISYAAVIPIFVKKLMSDQIPEIHGDGMQSRDFSYVDNVIEANLLACIAPQAACGQVFNIACGARTTLNDLYKKLAQLLGKNIEPRYVAPRPGDVKHSLADISKAKSLLGYSPK